MASYTNAVTDCRMVDVTIEQILAAPYGTSWTGAARVSVEAPPSGFVHLGAVVETSANLKVTREFDRLETGRPRTLQCLDIKGIAGTFNISLFGSSSRQVQYAFGNVLPQNVHTADKMTTIASVTNAGIITLTATTGELWSVNDWVVFAASAGGSTGLNTTAYESQISSMNGLNVCFDPVFAVTPTADDWVCKLVATKLPIGTSQIRQFHILGVADFPRGVQVVHDFPKAQAAGDWSESLNVDKRAQFDIQYELMTSTSTAWTTTSELILGTRYYFPPNQGISAA